jgi:DNA processing protein
MASTDGVISDRAIQLMQLVLLPGLGAVRASRLLDAFGGSADRVLGASHAAWCAVPGIGKVTSERARKGIPDLRAAVDAEIGRVADAGARVISIEDAGYPALLKELPDAPRLLYIRGTLGPAPDDALRDAYPLAVVGSRRCTQYGVEQAERFGGVLGRSGLTIVSGGARGIDSAAHRGALRAGGRTIVVQGCGLARAYPPENADLFERIVAEGRGAIVSELPMLTEPRGEHFPARNRIISGLSLGVLVIEAGRKSGALITAAMAAEEHGREVMVLPGRVDSEAIAGSLDLLKQGGGAMVTEPGDVLAMLENPARFAHAGTHAARYADPAVTREPPELMDSTAGSGGGIDEPGSDPDPDSGMVSAGSDGGALLASVASSGMREASFDDLLRLTGWESPRVRTALTMLELAGRVKRAGSRFSFQAHRRQ